ncbi:MAG: DUF3109 family protein, partial [Bacteroidota bacterium]
MIIIGEVLVSDDVVNEAFICNLNACKGACCWEGDFGAPLKEQEIQNLGDHLESILPYLDEQGRKAISRKGHYEYFEEENDHGTTLLENGRCAYLTMNELGIGVCGIEQAHRQGAIPFNKPISCHLYPIRVVEEPNSGFIALNYDRWDICSAACTLGKKEQLPVYQFLKGPLIRRFGESFYEDLHNTAQYMADQQP